MRPVLNATYPSRTDANELRDSSLVMEALSYGGLTSKVHDIDKWGSIFDPAALPILREMVKYVTPATPLSFEASPARAVEAREERALARGSLEQEVAPYSA